MLDNFDIFRILPDGDPIWIKSVPYLEEARVQIRRLTAISPGDYFVYSHITGSVVPEPARS